jgi:hypothetical protein
MCITKQNKTKQNKTKQNNNKPVTEFFRKGLPFTSAKLSASFISCNENAYCCLPKFLTTVCPFITGIIPGRVDCLLKTELDSC